MIYAFEMFQCKCIYGSSASSNCVNASNTASDAASQQWKDSVLILTSTLQFLIMLTELIETK